MLRERGPELARCRHDMCTFCSRKPEASARTAGAVAAIILTYASDDVVFSSGQHDNSGTNRVHVQRVRPA